MQGVEENKKKTFRSSASSRNGKLFPHISWRPIGVLAYNGHVYFETISLIGEAEIKKLEEFARKILTNLFTEDQKVVFLEYLLTMCNFFT